MKTPKPIQLAEDYCNKRYGFNNHEYDAFVAGFDAAKALVEAMLKSAHENKRFNDPSVVKPPSAEVILKQVLDEME